MRPEDQALLLEHQARCRSIYKRAYTQRLAEHHAHALQKQAQFAGMEPTGTIRPMRALGGGAMGLGVGALGALGAGALGADQKTQAALMGGGGLLGAGIGGFSQPADEEMMLELLRQQLDDEKAMAMDQYKAQLSGSEL